MDRLNKTEKSLEGRDPNVVARYQTSHPICEPLPMISLTIAVGAVTFCKAAKESLGRIQETHKSAITASNIGTLLHPSRETRSWAHDSMERRY